VSAQITASGSSGASRRWGPFVAISDALRCTPGQAYTLVVLTCLALVCSFGLTGHAGVPGTGLSAVGAPHRTADA
jgi:hypothetical protein